VRTDDLIRSLAQDVHVRWPFGRALTLAVICGVLIAGALFFLTMGFRADIVSAARTVRFLFKFVITLTLAAAALGLIARIARPGVPAGAWRWGLAMVPLLLGTSVAVELLEMPESTWGARLAGHNARDCLIFIPLLAIGPLAFLLIALRQGAPARPGLAGLVAGLAASGIAATFYAANCTDDSPLFVGAWYPAATAAVALAGFLAGSRLLKW
jgi:hypothetical protein